MEVPEWKLAAGMEQEQVIFAEVNVKGLAQQLRCLLRLKDAGNRCAQPVSLTLSQMLDGISCWYCEPCTQ